MKLLVGKPIAQGILLNLKARLQKLKKRPVIVIVQIGKHPASAVYVKNKQRMAKDLGIDVRVIQLSATVRQSDVERRIKTLNADRKITGIVVQLPIPSHLATDRIVRAVAKEKDIDGLHGPYPPPTPAAVFELFEFYNIDLEGKHIVLIGRGRLVGRPLEKMLKKQHYDVEVVDRSAPNTQYLAQNADILIVGIGSPKKINKEYIKPGAIVIDVGTNVIDSQLVGDVDAEDIKDVAGALAPVPGGVGQITVTKLLENAINAAEFHAK